MKTKQLRAIWYANRDRKIKKIQDLGLYPEFKAFNKGKKYICIQAFCRKYNVSL